MNGPNSCSLDRKKKPSHLVAASIYKAVELVRDLSEREVDQEQLLVHS